MDLNEIGRLAKAAQPSLQKADSDAKNQVLHRAAELLVEQSDFLLKENEKLSAFKRIRLLLNRHKMITAIVLITIMFMIFDLMLVSSFIEVLSSMNL